MTTRRNFLKQLLFGPTLLLPAELKGQKKEDSLCLIHSSETLSCCFPQTEDGLEQSKMRYKARYDWISAKRAEGNPLLLVDSGNFICGNPISDSMHGQLEMQAMQLTGYDALCLGEREIAIGPQALKKLLQHSPVPVLSTNANDAAFRDLLLPHLVLKKGKFRIGLMALNSENGYIKVRSNPLTVANEKANELFHKYNCDLVVCLSRLGRDDHEALSDRLLALNSENIQLIAGAGAPASKAHQIRLSNIRHKEIWVAGNPEYGTHMNYFEYKISSAKTIFLSKAHTVEIGK
jgi:2',3'-cyclic-nucleotide 2'-phosphodiesterase (5'-nucleotidase family)